MSMGSEGLRTGTSRWLEALEWHTTLCEADAAALTSGRLREWQQWYAQSENQRAFDQLTRLLANHPVYRAPDRPANAELEADRYDPSLSIMEWRQARQAATAGAPPRPKSWRVLVSAAFALAAALAAVLVLRPAWLRMASGIRGPVVYQTRLGERSELDLPDGSVITLGGQTRLSVDYTAHRRSIQLFQGAAWFRDIDMPDRPFVVTAGDGMITAIGTAFVVNRDSDSVVVMVTAGTVEVSARARTHRVRAPGRASVPLPSVPAIRLGRDQELAYSDDGAMGRVTRTDPRAVTAWTRGRLIFDDVPLRYVVENVDRYWSRHILVSPRAGKFRFSGIIYEDQIQYWLEGLRGIFPVAVDSAGAQVCVHMRAPRSPACAGPLPFSTARPSSN